MINLDLPIISYATIIFISLYGFVLFAWWWRKMGKASEVYIYMMMMFLATAFKGCTSLMGRIAFYEGTDIHAAFVTSVLWEVRALPIIIVLLLIVIRMTQRVRISITGNLSDDNENMDEQIKMDKKNNI